MLDGFAGGYNLYVQQHRGALPPWIVEITAADALAITHTRAPADAASASIVRSLQQKYPEGAAAPPVPKKVDDLPAEDEAGGDSDGSNAIAVSGRKTASGAPMLLGNPHLRWQQLYWEAHVRVPGRLDFYGSTLVGYPWLRAGFNDRLG